MNKIIRPLRWWDQVSPREYEMPDFLRAYMGKGKQFRTPKRMWEDLWRLKRGEMNQVMGMRKFGTLKNFTGPKYQKGIICATGAVFESGGTVPNLQDIQDDHAVTAPTQCRNIVAWDSDGSIEVDHEATTAASIVFVGATTTSDDANDHTNDWWPDQPETNEGLNWDIRYLNEVETGTPTNVWYLYDTGGAADRVSTTWYLLDTVSNDHGDGLQHGAISINRANGTAKNPSTGLGDVVVDIEIRATGSGSAVASQEVDLEVEGT